MPRRVSPAVHVSQPVLTPERKLWRAVLQQACADANSSQDCQEAVGPATRSIARRFLRAAGSSEAAILALVCDFAGVPYDRVVLWARQRFPPEPAGQDSVDEIIADELISVELPDSPPN